MKTLVKVWTLAWDNQNGTDCRVFGSEAEWLAYFKGVISQDIAGIETPDAEKIRQRLDDDSIGDAYELWQETYKNELDSYNWSCDELEVELDRNADRLAA